MAIIKYLRKLFSDDGPAPPLEYVQDEPAGSKVAAIAPHAAEMIPLVVNNDIDLSRQSDLEGYARDINVSKESIERWISSGLLMPEELKVAEKLVKIMRNH